MNPLSRWQGVANILGDLASAVASLSWVGDPLWSAAFWSRIFILVPGSFGSWGEASAPKKKSAPQRKKKSRGPFADSGPRDPPGLGWRVKSSLHQPGSVGFLNVGQVSSSQA